MALPLSPREQAAQAALLYHAKSPAAALTLAAAVSDAVSDVYDNDPDPGDEDLDGAVLAAIQNQGYITDQDSLSSQHDYLKANHAGFWAGNYTIIDASGGVHSLLVNSTDTRFLIGGSDEAVNMPSEGAAFSGQTLTVDNDRVTLELAFAATTDGLDLTADGIDLDDIAHRYAVLVNGSLTIKADGKGPRTVQGKRGVATPAGVLHAFGEEPPWIWTGNYQLRYTDTDPWQDLADPLEIGYDATTDMLSAGFGARQATAMFYRSGVISCQVEFDPGVVTQVTLAMQASAAGERKAYLWFETTGQIRTLTGYALNRLDADTLWATTPPAAAPMASPMALTSGTSRLRTATIGSTQSDFCGSPYDVVFAASNLATKGGASVAGLFKHDTLKLSGSTVSGFRVDELDASHVGTGRVALFTFTDASASAWGFAADSTLLAYQQLDASGLPLIGLDNARIGVVSSKFCALPDMVENDYYDLRLSLSGYADLDATGLTISLACDDASLPGVIALLQPDPGVTTCPFDTYSGGGQDAGLQPQIADYTKASVQVRGMRAGALQSGTHTYRFAIVPKSAAGFFTVTRTHYKPSGTTGEYVQDGTATTVSVPALMTVPIKMDASKPFALVDTSLPAAVIGQPYQAKVHAKGGVQPFVWRILDTSDALPAGLGFTPYIDDSGASATPATGKNFSANGLVDIGVSGTVAAGLTPGATCTLNLRALCDKSVVAKPAQAKPVITLAAPATESKSATDSATWKEYVSVAAGALALLLSIFIYKRVKASREKAAQKTKEIKTQADKLASAVGALSIDDLKKTLDEHIDDLNTAKNLDSARTILDAMLTDVGSKITSLTQERDAIGNPFDEKYEALDKSIDSLQELADKTSREINANQGQKDKKTERDASGEK